jgi:hypothetical protein
MIIHAFDADNWLPRRLPSFFHGFFIAMPFSPFAR